MDNNDEYRARYKKRTRRMLIISGALYVGSLIALACVAPKVIRQIATATHGSVTIHIGSPTEE